MTQFGGVRYSRAVRGAVWTQFREGGAALAAIQAGVVTVGGVEWKVCVMILITIFMVLTPDPRSPPAHQTGKQAWLRN